MLRKEPIYPPVARHPGAPADSPADAKPDFSVSVAPLRWAWGDTGADTPVPDSNSHFRTSSKFLLGLVFGGFSNADSPVPVFPLGSRPDPGQGSPWVLCGAELRLLRRGGFDRAGMGGRGGGCWPRVTHGAGGVRSRSCLSRRLWHSRCPGSGAASPGTAGRAGSGHRGTVQRAALEDNVPSNC